MAKSGIWQSLVVNEQREPWYIVFEALMAFDRPDLTAAIDYVVEDGTWPDEFRYGLEGLQAYRSFYNMRMIDCTPEQRLQIEAKDEEWTMELIDMFHKHQFGGLDPMMAS